MRKCEEKDCFRLATNVLAPCVWVGIKSFYASETFFRESVGYLLFFSKGCILPGRCSQSHWHAKMSVESHSMFRNTNELELRDIRARKSNADSPLF